METVATTRLSSKGQVVIPEELRCRLKLKPGTRFVVIGEDGVVILKQIRRPTMRDFDTLIRTARKQARKAGMKRSDVAKAIADVRTRG